MAIHSGRKLKQLAAEKRKVTTTQTAADALKSIVDKFGSVRDSTKYYHRGNGIWSIYKIAEDRRRTGKITTSIKKWKAEPWRWDLAKIDTKEGLVIKGKTAKRFQKKRNLSTSTTQKNLFTRF